MSLHDCWVGIDLGSTTTKAVIVDGQGAVLGRGITNSRSNYDVACAVARAEAFVDAQLGMARRALEGDDQLRDHADRLLDAIGLSFAEAKYVAALDVLRQELLRASSNRFFDSWQPALGAALEHSKTGGEP